MADKVNLFRSSVSYLKMVFLGESAYISILAVDRGALLIGG